MRQIFRDMGTGIIFLFCSAVIATLAWMSPAEGVQNPSELPAYESGLMDAE